MPAVAQSGRRLNAFLVGGAVRDGLLGIEPQEKDWVVVGSTPEEMVSLGFRQVGASFPVFLHPDNAEEYALARTEKKDGHGYHGFSIDFHPGVTLEEDLSRRDLTINAMARSDSGELIDPYGGKADLESRWLRHVSPAFAEDPLRVLRVARFAARFARLGFRVHESTMNLMRRMTASGELDHLVPERIWAEVAKALAADTPGEFIAVLRECGALAVLLPEVDDLFGVPQPERYHPEIDTGVHVMMCMDYAARQGRSARVVFALLMHDLGKALTAPDRLPSHIGHEKRGVPLVDRVCDRWRVPNSWRDLARKVCELHLRCHQTLEMRPSRLMALLEDADLLRRPEELQPFVQACEADYRGREGRTDQPYPQAAWLGEVLEAARNVQARELELEGLDGPAVGERLRQERIRAIGRLNRPF